MITSKNNQQLKNVRKLLESAKYRKETGLFVVEGERLFKEVPEGLIAQVYVSEKFQGNLPDEKICEVVDAEIFKGISDTVSPQGILAVVRKPRFAEEDAPEGKVILLDGVRDPGNMGTIIRTAEAAGVRAVYLSPDCADIFNPKVVRSTMGSIFRVPVFYADLLEVIKKFKESKKAVYGTSLEADKFYDEVSLSDAGIVIGNEANGISREVLSSVTCNVKIPMKGKVESLNAAVCAAVLMFSK